MNTTFDSISNEISAYNWFCTDSTAMQHCAELDKYTYAFIEANGEEVYFDTIDIRDLFISSEKTNETARILGIYGYDGIKDLETKYGESWAQILAECVFEIKSMEKPPLFIGTEDECEQLVAKITGCSVGISA